MKRRINSIYPTYFLIPALIAFTLFFIVPIIMGFGLSLTNWDMDLKNVKFIGLQNYISILHDKDFLKAIRHTLTFAVSILFLRNIAAVFLAIALNEKFCGRNFLRTVFYLPSVFSYVVTGIIFLALFKADGLVNQLLSAVAIGKVRTDWIGSPGLAMGIVILMDSWVWIGFHMIIILAGLQSIGEEYYEVAKVEGATFWQKLRYVLLPMIAPTLRQSLVLTITGGLRVFEQVMVLTYGGPGGATTTAGMYVYQMFSLGFFAKSTAVEMLISLTVFLATALVTRLFRGMEMDLS